MALVTLLLDHGGDACTRNKYGFTALWQAACYGRLEVCLLLLSRGADLMVVMYDILTALEDYGTSAYPQLSPEVMAQHRDALLAAWHAGP